MTTPVIVPRSLQPPSPQPPKGYLSRVRCRDFVIILLIAVAVGVAVAHCYKVIDLNEMLRVVKSKLPPMPNMPDLSSPTSAPATNKSSGDA